MNKLLTGLLGLLLSIGLHAQTKKLDSLAIRILDRMSDVIGELESCSFKLDVAADLPEYLKGNVKRFSDYEVYMSGPSKMLVNAHGYRGHRQFMYNGKQLAYYFFEENNYGIIPAPKTTLKMVDSLNHNYGIEFPAIDFFYPAFTDDVIQNSDSVKYLGIVKIDGKEYFDIIAFGKDMNVEFWINNNAYNLPGRFSITYKDKEGRPQYNAAFSEWEINPVLPAAMFDFLPPPDAAQVRILSKTRK